MTSAKQGLQHGRRAARIGAGVAWRSGRRRVWRVGLRIAALVAASLAADARGQLGIGLADATPASEAPALVNIIRDGKLDAASRRQAVQTLLDRGSARGLDALMASLKPDADAGTQIVIVQALAGRQGDPPLELSPALMSLLDATEGALQAEVAAAVGKYHDRRIVRRLTDAAVEPGLALAKRRGAILAIAHQRSQSAAKTLLQLIQPDQPQQVRRTALTALSQMTGLGEMDGDPARWQQWWEQVKNLTEDRWMEMLLDNHARRGVQLAQDSQRMHERLVELQRQLYRLAPPDGREARLVSMLGDPVEAIRRLALELVLQRVGEPVGGELREALRQRLDDPSPAVRQGAARRLADVGDEVGADAVTRRLAIGQEMDVEVLRAYLYVMARVPRAEAMTAAIGLLDDVRVRADAAAAAARGVERGLIPENQRGWLLDRARAAAPEGQPPEPAVVELLGRVGEESDWRRIAAWMSGGEAAVKKAAATAWKQSPRPLDEMAKWAGDADVQPIFIEAAERRGSERAVLLALASHKPEQDVAALSWRRALRAVAERASAEAVVEADRVLTTRGEAAAVRDEVLSGAIAHHAPTSKNEPGRESVKLAEPVIDLLLARAELRLAQADPAQALTDLRRVANADPKPGKAQAERCEVATFRAAVAASDTDAACDAARRILAFAPNGDDRRDAVFAALIAIARRQVAAGQLAPAQKVAKSLRELSATGVSPAVAQQIQEVESLTGTTTTAPNGAPPPATRPAARVSASPQGAPRLSGTSSPNEPEKNTPQNGGGPSPHRLESL